MLNASNSGVPTSTPVESSPSRLGRKLIQREDKQIAGILQVVEFDRMQVPSAALNCNVLFGSDGVGHRRALQRGPDVETPEFFERFVVIRHQPTVLQGREQQA